MQGIHTHNNFFFFTASLVFLLLASSYVSSTPAKEDHLLLQGFLFATELIAYFSLSLSREWRRFVGLIVVLMAVSTLLRELGDWELNSLAGLVISLFFYSAMTYVAARQVLFSGNIELNSIVGTLAIYLLLGIVWTFLYLLALEVWPGAFNGIEYRDWQDNFGVTAYYSYVTMTTLGYGDITPALTFTQTLASLQAIAGTFYMTVAVASLVSAFSRKSR